MGAGDGKRALKLGKGGGAVGSLWGKRGWFGDWGHGGTQGPKEKKMGVVGRLGRVRWPAVGCNSPCPVVGGCGGCATFHGVVHGKKGRRRLGTKGLGLGGGFPTPTRA